MPLSLFFEVFEPEINFTKFEMTGSIWWKISGFLSAICFKVVMHVLICQFQNDKAP